MAAKVEKQFDAAVNVIKCLPKNGPFQPSYEMMKRFYGLYKQATEGPCTKPKPGFWDVVGRQKWDAWSTLGDMTKVDAMQCYINELKKVFQKYSDPAKVQQMLAKFPDSGKMMEMVHVYLSDPSPAKIKEIVETMPHTPEVSKFVQHLGPFFEAVTDDDENDAGDEHEKIPNGDVNDSHPIGVPPDSVISTERENAEDNREDSHSEEEEEEEAVEDDEEDEQEDGDENQEEDDQVEEDVDRETKTATKTEEVPVEGAVVVPETVVIADNKAFVLEVTPTTEKLTIPVKGNKRESSESEEDNGFVRISAGMNGNGGINGDHIPHLGPPSITSDTDSGDEIFCDSMEKQSTEEDSEIPLLISPKPNTLSLATSTPSKNSFTVQAEVYPQKPRVTFKTPEVNGDALGGAGSAEGVMIRGGGGGDDGESGQSSSRSAGRAGGGASGHSSSRGSSRDEAHRTPSRSSLRASGGSGGGGGGRSGRQSSPPKGDVTEQIAVALERLQQDMNSVLIRLNTLETLSLRHQAESQQSGMWSPGHYQPNRDQSASSSWWPFSNLSGKSVFFILVWPFIVNSVIHILSKRRKRR
ncbi:acyl-CoA-binding domain-containing protein 5-like isoform X3 [Ptychodera flava]|uniref:acyl-CoA-binding domain-containing protein 5-like isoform X3 n=1 Tax=Ptychodera flava TaxID=63121 RepID=UPI00396A78F1